MFQHGDGRGRISLSDDDGGAGFSCRGEEIGGAGGSPFGGGAGGWGEGRWGWWQWGGAGAVKADPRIVGASLEGFVGEG